MGKTQFGKNGGMELKRGPWTPEEDQKLYAYIQKNGHGSWSTLPQKAGLQRCGKSCRIRWINYLRPDIRRGKFTPEEDQTIIQLHALLGNRWSIIAAFLKNRTDNQIKNYWNCRLKKRLAKMGIDPSTHRRKTSSSIGFNNNTEPKNVAKIVHMAQWESTRLEAEARLVKRSKLENRSLNSVESEILSNLEVMPHFYASSFDPPRESKPPPPPCLDILKAWEIVAGDACVSPNMSNNNNNNDNDSVMKGSTLDALSSTWSATTTDVFDFESIDMMIGSQDSSFEELWEIISCESNEGKPSNNEGLSGNYDDGRRAGEELHACGALSYCGRLGSLLLR